MDSPSVEWTVKNVQWKMGNVNTQCRVEKVE